MNKETWLVRDGALERGLLVCHSSDDVVSISPPVNGWASANGSAVRSSEARRRYEGGSGAFGRLCGIGTADGPGLLLLPGRSNDSSEGSRALIRGAPGKRAGGMPMDLAGPATRIQSLARHFGARKVDKIDLRWMNLSNPVCELRRRCERAVRGCFVGFALHRRSTADWGALGRWKRKARAPSPSGSPA